jgi:hypothetical protein
MKDLGGLGLKLSESFYDCDYESVLLILVKRWRKKSHAERSESVNVRPNYTHRWLHSQSLKVHLTVWHRYAQKSTITAEENTEQMPQILSVILISRVGALVPTIGRW